MKIFDYIKFFEVSGKAVWWIVVGFFVMQAIMEFLKFRGVIIPEFLRILARFERRKKEKETIQKMAALLPTLIEVPELLKNANTSLSNLDKHYSDDNIRMRDEWIRNVNEKLEKHDDLMNGLVNTVNENSENTLSLLIESKRSAIIDFASKVIDPNIPVTHAEFERIFRIDKEYDEIIEKHELENGEVDIAMGLIREAYKNHMMNRSFLEDVRGLKRSK